MNNAQRTKVRMYARFCGIAATLLGLALVWVAAYLMYEQWIFYGTVRLRSLMLGAVIAAAATFCLIVGYRLTLMRPNKYGSLLTPAAWYLTGLFLGLAAVALAYVLIVQREYTESLAAAVPGFLGFLAIRAGMRARNGVNGGADAL